ncbi:hypothetical protein BFP97_06795 [Roseivirga sp. 4D4]|uniref:hypothetical protein n=1 Tax=Roseivirga sp. 4D4 TaxID=1889784 RepID=UPI000853A2E1|nr:hypothetical protein [Roseivirga sp. 4D4]OEK01234.1 hypothetical protein BFP97_06795 [Roseivirga sp. 4D4]
MKKLTLHLIFFCTLIFTISSCNKPAKEEAYPTEYFYEVSVSLMDNLDQAPALQSFAHGVDGETWLLFAGRTNQDLDDGGLHDMNGNYATTSFVPWSFNENILVYNTATDQLSGMPFQDLVGAVKTNLSKHTGLVTQLNTFATVFRNTNPLVMQEGGYLYLVGGYGTPLASTQNSSAYQTFGHVAKINISGLIKLVTGKNLDKIDWEDLFAFGSNDELISTGAEMFKIDDTFYVAGGHNFGSSVTNSAFQGQKYLDAVYPFTMVKKDSFSLDISVGTPISDIAPTKLNTVTADATSKFRRRDGPVVSGLFYDQNKNLTEGLTFYGGVFKPSYKKDGQEINDAWNSAIYVHPGVKVNSASQASPYYTLDEAYNQNNLNVYACADFEIFDAGTETVQTFLFGGIGNGTYQSDRSLLSGFTDSLMHITYDLNTGTSTPKVGNTNIFGNTSSFYGAESTFIFNSQTNIVFKKAGNDVTEVVDADATFGESNSIDIGYIYGGIEAFNSIPGTFGPGKSRASNKVWKVTLNRSPLKY